LQQIGRWTDRSRRLYFIYGTGWTMFLVPFLPNPPRTTQFAQRFIEACVNNY